LASLARVRLAAGPSGDGTEAFGGSRSPPRDRYLMADGALAAICGVMRSRVVERAGLAAWLGVVAFGLLIAAFPRSLPAQPLYKYQDTDGNWVYADTAPSADFHYERLDIDNEDDPAEVVVMQRTSNAGISLIAGNSFYSDAQIAFRISMPSNVAAEVPLQGNRLLEPRSETALVDLFPTDPNRPMRFEYSYRYILGAPGAKHEPDRPYRLPFAVASSHAVSQAFPDAVTHSDPSSRYAIDFAMPIGTGIYAARGGRVIQIAGNYFESGLDPSRDLERANIVRVLHDDGTMALYAHLNWHSIRVVPGQRIRRGEYIADSGNTGFSTGPHLHFVVQRNVGGAIESLPVLFGGEGGREIRLRSGDVVTAR
jgi:murein DD-endopeptidase MepM/ murein hydrolase activator NlpD